MTTTPKKTYEERRDEAAGPLNYNCLEHSEHEIEMFKCGADWARTDRDQELIEQAGDVKQAIKDLAENETIGAFNYQSYSRGARAMIPILQAVHSKEIEALKS